MKLNPLHLQLLNILSRGGSHPTDELALSTSSLNREVNSAMDGLEMDDLVHKETVRGQFRYRISQLGAKALARGPDHQMKPTPASAATPDQVSRQATEQTSAEPPANRPSGQIVVPLTTREQLMAQLRSGPKTNGELAEALSMSTSAVGYQLKVLFERSQVERECEGGVRAAWKLTASAGEAETPFEKFVKTKREAKALAGARLDGAGKAAGKKRKAGVSIDAQLDALSARLAPIRDLPVKVATLDRLATLMDASIADVLVQIRNDIVRVGAPA